MSQHFLLTAAARTVSLKQILRMEEAEAWTLFCTIRWPETDGAPVCPQCGCPTCWACPRPNGAPRFRCSACRRDFSPTSGTLFAFHKLEIRDYLAAVVIFCDEVKGKAALALSRDLDVQYKTAFVLAHKIREAMASEVKELRLGGAGRHVEVDGCYVGGHVRPANRKADRIDRRLAENRSGRRQVVVVIRERALSGTSLGGTLPAVFASEDAAASFIRARVDRASTVHADEVFGLERPACPVRHPADQPLGRVRHRRGLHQPGGIVFLQAAPGREGPSPSHLRRLPCSLCAGGLLEGGSPPRQQRPAVPHRPRAGHPHRSIG